MAEKPMFNQTPYAHAKLVDNLLGRTRQFAPETVVGGKSWYKSGQEDAEYLGQKMGRDAIAGGAVLGKLSSRTDWNINRMMGLQLMDLSDKQVNLIHQGAELSRTAGAKATSAIRRRAGLSGTPLSGQALPEISAAIRVRDNEVDNPLDIFKKKETGSNKTLDFSQALATGGKHEGTVIDTHAYDAALDDYNVKYGTGNRHLERSGTYKFMQSVYNTAHSKALKAGLIPSDTTANEFQAMHWLHQINNKVHYNQNAATTAKANVTKTTNLVNNNPQYDPAAHGLAPLAIKTSHLTAFNEGMTK